MLTRRVETALVTGAGSGMGKAAALELGRRGIRVAAADLDPEAARRTVEAIEAEGHSALPFEVDVSRSDSVARLFEALRGSMARLDMVVHAAGILGRTALGEELEDDDWRRVMAVNLDGSFYCCREAVRWMREQGGGRIVLFSSIASLAPMPGALHYAVTKAAVNMLAKTLAKEVAHHNIRVNVVAPGYVDTPMIAGLPDGFLEGIIKKTPLKRLAAPEEIAGLVAFLAQPEADFFTGQVLSPNGGLVI